MHLVKALTVASLPLRLDGPNVSWAANQLRIVEDEVILHYQNNPASFTVLAGPGMAEVQAALQQNLAALGAGSVPALSGVAGVTTSDVGMGEVRRTVLTLDAVDITMTDAGVNGSHGALQLYDFPAGNLLFLGGTTNLTLAVPAAGGIAATAAIGGGVGTVTNDAADETLTTTEQDLIPSTACTLAANAGTMKGKSATAGVAVFDGTATPINAFLNFTVPDADSTATETLTVSGTVTLLWVNLGDN